MAEGVEAREGGADAGCACAAGHGRQHPVPRRAGMRRATMTSGCSSSGRVRLRAYADYWYLSRSHAARRGRGLASSAGPTRTRDLRLERAVQACPILVRSWRLERGDTPGVIQRTQAVAGWSQLGHEYILVTCAAGSFLTPYWAKPTSRKTCIDPGLETGGRPKARRATFTPASS